MLRSMFQVYVKRSDLAVKFYQSAFNAKLMSEYPNEDGTYMHAELDVYGQILALSESLETESVTGNTMQLCLHLGQGKAEEVQRIYEILKENAQPHAAVGNVGYSPCGFGLTDQYGVNWCVFE